MEPSPPIGGSQWYGIRSCRPSLNNFIDIHHSIIGILTNSICNNADGYILAKRSIMEVCLGGVDCIYTSHRLNQNFEEKEGEEH